MCYIMRVSFLREKWSPGQGLLRSARSTERGFDYNFTNYNFRKELLLFVKSILPEGWNSMFVWNSMAVVCLKLLVVCWCSMVNVWNYLVHDWNSMVNVLKLLFVCWNVSWWYWSQIPMRGWPGKLLWIHIYIYIYMYILYTIYYILCTIYYILCTINKYRI